MGLTRLTTFCPKVAAYVIAISSVMFASQPVALGQLTIGALHLQSSSRSSLYTYDYTYTADLTNQGAAESGVSATATTSATGSSVLSGTLTFGTVAANATVTSTGTFTIRQDRRYSFNPAGLVWKYSGNPVLASGTVSSTNNPQVALYTVQLPSPGSVTVHFGTTTAYGLQTWTQSTAVAGPVSILVAGMLANTQYHMQATIQFTDGTNATDTDHTFTAGAPASIPSLSAVTTSGQTPQPGIEQLTMINGPTLGVVATDLQARVIWTYIVPNDTGGYTVEGAKLMQNGHFLLSIGNGSSYVLTGAPHGVVSIREIDLAGNIINELKNTDLTAKLQGAGYNLNILEFHHDVTPLPNGHRLVLGNVLKAFTDLPGYPGVTNVLGDVIVDLDANMNPVWVWNEFDHLDVNRHPMGFPDWTHTNAVVYSPSDHNILVSMRHQNWVVKVDYRDGAGGGGILWHLGEGGDFTLQNGVDPTDWQYAQHYPSFFSANTSGVFSLGVMDNGNDRIFPTGVVCGTAGNPPCQYTTIPVFRIDENAKTATLTSHQILPTSLYSFFGGNTELLANGDTEYDLAGVNTTDSDVFEVTPGSTPQTVWHLHSSGANAYRGYRLPSLYPGVQW